MLLKLTVHLPSLVNNFSFIQEKVGAACLVGAAVKANAYGLGIEAVAQALEQKCALFFVATFDEALKLRTLTKKPIATLNGLVAPPDLYDTHNIWPILGSYSDIEKANKTGKTLPCLVQIDTGMNRLGLNKNEVQKLSQNPHILNELDTRYFMSHFISSENHGCPLAAIQFKKFMEATKNIGIKTSLSISNSGGVFRDPAYHLNMVRPGAALYGINPTPHTTNPMQPVVKLESRILKIQAAAKGETIGYDATYTLTRPSVLATLSLGYADGFLRSLSNKGFVYWNNYECPIVGRVSMDLTVIDVTDMPEQHRTGDWAEILGPNQTVDDVAKCAQTNGYEILCALSHRAQRFYIN